MTLVRRFFLRGSGLLQRRYRLLKHLWEPRLRPSAFRDWSGLDIVDFNQAAVSVDPAMYDGGRLYEVQGFELRRLAEVKTRLVYPAYSYTRPASPSVMVDPFKSRLTEVFDHAQRLPGGVEVREATLPEALIFGDVIYVRQDGELIALYESCRANDRASLKSIAREHLRCVRPRPDLDGAVFLGSPGSANFGHWLTDDLTRVVVPEGDGRTTWLMTDHGKLMNDRRRESLRLALDDPAASVRFIQSNEPVLVHNLRYTSRASHHPSLKSPQAIAVTRARVTAKMSEGSPRDERLFITRPRGERGSGILNLNRELVNAEEILGLLAARGFRVFDPLAASAQEQARACFQAKTIVGVMGAAMTNTMFARPGTKVVYLAASGWTEPFFWDLAAVCEHDYHCLYGPTAGDGDPWGLPFRIDAQVLVATLDEIDAG